MSEALQLADEQRLEAEVRENELMAQRDGASEDKAAIRERMLSLEKQYKESRARVEALEAAFKEAKSKLTATAEKYSSLRSNLVAR